MLLFSHRGFTLLEVVVAVGLLAVAALAIAGALGAAVEYSGAAALARLALIEAEAVADTATKAASYPSGWRDLGDPGADHLPGTVDDTVRVNAPALCRRRITPSSSGAVEWLWIEVQCGQVAHGAPVRGPGGRAGGRARLVVAR